MTASALEKIIVGAIASFLGAWLYNEWRKREDSRGN